MSRRNKYVNVILCACFSTADDHAYKAQPLAIEAPCKHFIVPSSPNDSLSMSTVTGRTGTISNAAGRRSTFSSMSPVQLECLSPLASRQQFMSRRWKYRGSNLKQCTNNSNCYLVSVWLYMVITDSKIFLPGSCRYPWLIMTLSSCATHQTC